MTTTDRGRRTRHSGLWLVIGVMSALMGSATVESRPIQALNSRVVLDLPEGYVPSPSFSGFYNEALGVSYVIQELPAAAYQELVQGFTPETLAARAIQDAEIGTLARPGKHIYIRGRQAQAGTAYEKLIVVLMTDGLTVLVTANVPKKALDAKSTSIQEVEAVLASTSIAPTTNARDLFGLGDQGSFKPAGRFLGTARLYTLDGSMEPTDKGKARSAFIVAPSLDQGAVGNAGELAQQLIRTLAGFTDITPAEGAAVKISGLEGVAIEAKAVHESDRHEVRVYQVLLVRREGGYYRIVGVARAEEAERLMPEFRRMAESFVQLPQP